MTYELKEIIETAMLWQKKGMKTVLATVVALEGSSYRRPGVRMLLNENGKWLGAVSGGCVEKEVYNQAQTVFKTQKSKVMSYDGRFRLGCEGILYLLLEPLHISESCFHAFSQVLKGRKEFTCKSYFQISTNNPADMGSSLLIENKSYDLSPTRLNYNSNLSCFSQVFSPIFQLYIFGAEHDAVKLCKMGNQLGWEVHVVAPPDEAKSLDYFAGASSLLTPTIEKLDSSGIDSETAVVLMTHSFNKDVQYLMALRKAEPAYFGLLGPSHRRERLFSKFLDYFPETEADFFEKIHGPAGIDIGAESAAEIALAILAEILTVIRRKEPIFLKDKAGHIHG